MEPIPHTQHRPINARANPVVVAHPRSFRRRFNLRKADWDGYSTELDKLIEDVEPIPVNYGGFVDKIAILKPGRLRPLKITGQYLFCATHTKYTND